MSQRKGNVYTFGFAVAVCLACSIVLALAATALKPRQVANARLDIMKNLLVSVGHDYAKLTAMQPEEVFGLYDKEFDEILLDKNNEPAGRDFMVSELVKLGYEEAELQELGTTDLLNRFRSKMGILVRRAGERRTDYDPGYKMLFVHKKDGQPDAYVVPIEGYGLWDIIKGYVALGTDLNTVKGITFYEHKETPGLGARITEDWFKDNYKGKEILNEQGDLVSITIAKGKAEDAGPHTVDGISGATLTGDGINQFLERDLETYEPYFKTLRQGS